MKLTLKLCIVLGICALAYVLSKQMIKSRTSGTEVHVAIFTPVTHNALEEIEQGFVQTLQKMNSDKTYIFKTFNANGNKSLLRAQAEEIVHGGYQGIFTIGALCSHTIGTLLNKKGIQIPHVFGGVEGPEFATMLQEANVSTTGVYLKPYHETMLKIIYAVRPQTHTVLLVYDPTHGAGLEKEKREIESSVRQAGGTLQAVEIYQPQEIYPKVSAVITQVDCVLVLTDNTVVSGIDAVIQLCNRHNVPLFASDLPSGKKGAAVAYGINEYEVGVLAAQKMIVSMRASGSTVPSITPCSGMQLELNQAAQKLQNLSVDQEVLETLRRELL